jgi:hypothetical protein
VRNPAFSPIERLLAIRGRAHLRGAEKDSAVLAELVTELHLPASLLGGKRIASQTCCLLGSVVHTASAEDRRAICNYIRELRWIIRHSRRLSLLLFEEDADRQKFLRCRGGNPYVHNGATEHGLCSLIWQKYPSRANQPKDGHPNLRPQFDALRKQATLSHLVALRYWAHKDDWLSPTGPGRVVREAMYRRTLAIKHFAMNRYISNSAYRGALAAIPLTASRLQLDSVLCEIRRNLPETSVDVETKLPQDLLAIRRLLRVADNPTVLRLYASEEEFEEEAKDRDTVTSNPPLQDIQDGAPYEFQCETDEDDEDETDELEEDNSDDKHNEDDEEAPDNPRATTPPGVTYTRHRWSEDQIKDCIEAGIHPADALTAETLHLSSHRSGHDRAQQAMRNQNLSISWNNLEIEELGLTLEILDAQAGRSSMDFENLALARAVVARGWKLVTAQSLEVRADRPVEVKSPILLLSVRDTGKPEWLLPAMPIPFHKEHGDYEGCRRTVKCFVTSDYWGVGELLRKLIAIKFPGWRGEPVHPFAEPIHMKQQPDDYQRRLKRSLENAKSDRGPGLATRVTLARLGRVLPQRIYDLTAGNLTVVTYATLRTNPTGEDDRFYATPAVRSVQNAEYTAVSTLDEELRAMGCDVSIDLRLTPSDSSGYLGSPMCPTLQAIEAFLLVLLETIAKQNGLLSDHRDRDAAIARHNAFIMLTFCVATLGTCHRPAHGGVPELGEIDTSSGRVCIVDKGRAKARLGAAANLAVAQLRACHQYLHSFGFEQYFAGRPDLPFFFIGQDGSFLPVGPAALKQQGLPFVANFARHAVKTIFDEWCEEGDERICQEWISALLGHFTTGEEPFGACSTFHNKHFAAAMRSALDDLLRKVKFQPIDILGRQITVHEPEVQRFLESTAPQSDGY